ncbi:MAG: prepilin-type N-terminal cleavage/methylation domain-containing protein [Pseudomonadota bacterium]
MKIRKTQIPTDHQFKGGFTAIELLIVLAIIAVLAGIAMLNIKTPLERERLSAAFFDLRNTLNAARVYAIRHNSGFDTTPFDPSKPTSNPPQVVVKFLSSGDLGAPPGGGYFVFEDKNGDWVEQVEDKKNNIPGERRIIPTSMPDTLINQRGEITMPSGVIFDKVSLKNNQLAYNSQGTLSPDPVTGWPETGRVGLRTISNDFGLGVKILLTGHAIKLTTTNPSANIDTWSPEHDK